MGSHSVACHLTHVNVPRLNPSRAGRYSIYLPRRDGRLSWSWWLVIYRDGLPVCRQSPIHVVTTWYQPGRESNPEVDRKSNMLRGVQWHIVLDGVPDAQGKGRFGGQTPSQNMQLQTSAKPSVLCCHLANTNEELGGLAAAIPLLPNYFGPGWF